MTGGPPSSGDDALVVRREEVAVFDRGDGVTTVAYVGRWNSDATTVTTGTTTFLPGRGLPLHTHNVEETVLVIAGRAQVVVGDGTFDLATGDATWVPPGVEHRVLNVSDDELTIYWVYGGREVTRTIVATGETVAHLSEADRGGSRIDDDSGQDE
jgi:quercetin dioxygenase-like cupin family protein